MKKKKKKTILFISLGLIAIGIIVSVILIMYFNTSFSIKFETNSIDNVETQTVKRGGKATKPSVREQYSDDEFTYNFVDWFEDKDFTIAYNFEKKVEKDYVLYAKWKKTTNVYIVTWKNWDETVLEIDEDVLYGTMPEYNGEDPTKSNTAENTYVFNGWDKEISKVTGDVTYTATFIDTATTYTVTWENWDGSVLETDKKVPYGTMPVYNGATPTRENTAEYTFTFKGWDKEISKVTKDITYTAEFSYTINTFTIQWKNWDGTLLEKDKNVPYGTIPEYNSITPTRENTEGVTYIFNGWDKEITPTTVNAQYKATFISVANEFTVTWENWDGSVLETDKKVPYGTMAEYNGATPTRENTAEYTYIFNGWDKTISIVTGDITYKATFTSTKNKYIVTWKNWDETVLEIDEDVLYGTMAEYNGLTPTRTGSAELTYTFDGWDKEVSAVISDVTYKAIFTYVINEYNVVWKNWDDTILETDTNVPYGTMPEYNGEAPSRSKTAEYTYTFNGWDKTISIVTGDIAYKATFTSTKNKYIVTWKNWDGTTLETDTNVPYGTMAEYNGLTPTRTGSAELTYTFDGWDKEVSAVTADVTYTAIFTNVTNKYTVTWKNWDDTILETDTNVPYGTMPEYNGEAPSRSKTAEYTYTFNGWNKQLSKVTDDVTYTATYTNTKNKYTVVWKNWDDTILETDTNVPYGTMPEYNGSTPTAVNTIQNYYVFNGWNNEISAVTGDATYKAIFKPEPRKYDVYWRNYDRSIVKVDYSQEYRNNFIYAGDNPTRENTESTKYTFSTWAFEGYDGDTANYIAIYNSFPIYYTVKWENGYGNIVETDKNCLYDESTHVYNGETPTKESSFQYTYTFNGWSKKVNLEDKEIIYSAEYTYTVNSYMLTIVDETNSIDITGYQKGVYYDYGTNLTLIANDIPADYTIKWERSDGDIHKGDSYKIVIRMGYTITISLIKLYDIKDDKIYFGLYPQSQVTDNTIINNLNDLLNGLPTEDDNAGWISYNYQNAEGQLQMYYIDIDINDDEIYDYRGVYFTEYRNALTKLLDIATNEVYWFLYEPIEWKILKNEGGKALIISNYILDAQWFEFSSETDKYVHNGGEGYANNYELSYVRKWLNADFYNLAFNLKETGIINTTLVDNTTLTIDYDNNDNSQYLCADTYDKMFLLSTNEAKDLFNTDDDRKCNSNYYAVYQGYCGGWLLRSPYEDAYRVNLVSNGAILSDSWHGGSINLNFVAFPNGIRPACWINL